MTDPTLLVAETHKFISKEWAKFFQPFNTLIYKENILIAGCRVVRRRGRAAENDWQGGKIFRCAIGNAFFP
jgi:hypothetical protein